MFTPGLPILSMVEPVNDMFRNALAEWLVYAYQWILGIIARLRNKLDASLAVLDSLLGRAARGGECAEGESTCGRCHRSRRARRPLWRLDGARAPDRLRSQRMRKGASRRLRW